MTTLFIFIFIFLRPYKWKLLSLIIIIIGKTKTGIIQSFIRIKLNHYRMIARAIVSPSKEITSLKKTFCDLPGSTISKLKELHSEELIWAGSWCSWNLQRIWNWRRKNGDNRPIANMATISPKRGFSVATVAKGWLLVYMLMRVRYLVLFFTLETIKNFHEEVIVASLC